MRPICCHVIASLLLVGLTGCSAWRAARSHDLVTIGGGRHGGSPALGHHQRGVRLIGEGKLNGAALAFQKALQKDDSFGPSYNNLGLIYYEQGDLYAAAQAFENAVQLLPERAEPLNNLGLTMEAADKLEEAISYYVAAAGLDAANPEYLGNAIRARMRLGLLDDALRDDLRTLLLLETRPDWREWANEQLAMWENQDEEPAEPEQLPLRNPAFN